MRFHLLTTLAWTARRIWRYLPLFLFWFISGQVGTAVLSAETPRVIRFDHLSTDEGLPQEAVHAVYQDRVGFMWLGTQEGLVRFDGYDFTVYEHDPDEPSSLDNSWVWSIAEDRRGNLWIGTDGGGLHRFDRARETFEHFRHDDAHPDSLSSDRVRIVFVDGQDTVWVGTDDGLNRLESDGRSFQRFSHDPSDPNSISSSRIRSMIETTSGNIWVGTDGGGISRLDEGTGRFAHYRHDPDDPTSLGSDRVREIYQSPDGTVWVGTYEAGLDRFLLDQSGFVHYQHDESDSGSLTDNRIRDIFEDSNGTLWIGTDGGLSEWRPHTQDFSQHRHLPTDPASLSDDRVNAVYEDRGGVLWIGTYNGLNRFSLAAAAFAHYRHTPDEPSGLSHNVVNAFDEDADGNVWIGTYGGGLNRLDPVTGQFTHYKHDDDDPTSLSDDRVMAVRVDRTGAVWAGTFADGLSRLDPATKRFTHFRHDAQNPHSLSRDAITSILEDRTGRIWVGTYRGGLNQFASDTGAFTRFRHDPSDPQSLSSDRVLALHEDQSGVLWVGTDGGGLNRLQRSTRTFTHFRHDPQDESSLSSDTSWSIHEDRAGGFWIGTRGAGVNHWRLTDRREGRPSFRRYLKEDGLPSAVIYGVNEDWHGRLWLSTNRGLSRLDPETDSVKNYSPRHGLQDLDFNFGAVLRTRENVMYFGGSNGFNSFYPDAIVDGQQPPSVVLTGIYKLNRRISSDVETHALSELTVNPDEPVVAFEFAALDYTSPEQNLYKYRLDGFDEQWTDAGGLRRATYTNLDPGHYTFRVRAANSDGVWNDIGLALGVTVLPPWWMSPWAGALYAFIVAFLILGAVWTHRNRLQAQARRSGELEREVDSRTRELGERNAELAEVNQKLEIASHTDTLTGLYNRRYLADQVEKDVALVLRTYTRDDPDPDSGDLPRDLLFLMLDVDGLKGVNDKYGHAAGDRTLVQIRQILERVCRKSDTLVRWGGDEFLLVGRESDRDMGERLAERLRQAITEHDFQVSSEHTTRMSCSIGFAMYPFMPSAPKLMNWEQVIHMADRGLYEAKGSGRNRYVGLGAARHSDPQTVLNRMDDPLESLVEEDILTLRRGPEGSEREAGDSDGRRFTRHIARV